MPFTEHATLVYFGRTEDNLPKIKFELDDNTKQTWVWDEYSTNWREVKEEE